MFMHATIALAAAACVTAVLMQLVLHSANIGFAPAAAHMQQGLLFHVMLRFEWRGLLRIYEIMTSLDSNDYLK